MPIVSIIIPTFNRSNLISRSVKSVLNQTMVDFELIIVDDGSKDNTDKIIGSFKDERIRYFKQEINKGQNAALNFGVVKSNGKYVAFLDSDDEWMPEFLEKLIRRFDNDQSLGAVYSRAFGCSNSGKISEGYQFNLEGNVYKEALTQGYLSYMITIIVKKDVINELKPDVFDPEFVYGQDDDFCLRVSRICKIGLVKEPLAIIHNDGDIYGNEPSICMNNALIAEGRKKLIIKYKDHILKYCGKTTLAAKYLSLGIIYLRTDNFGMAGASFSDSYKLEKTIRSILYLLYSRSVIIRKIWNICLDFYRFLKNGVKSIVRK